MGGHSAFCNECNICSIVKLISTTPIHSLFFSTLPLFLVFLLAVQLFTSLRLGFVFFFPFFLAWGKLLPGNFVRIVSWIFDSLSPSKTNQMSATRTRRA